MVDSYLIRERKFQAQRRNFLNSEVTFEEPRAMSIKATSVISDTRLESLKKYLDNEVTQIMSHELLGC